MSTELIEMNNDIPPFPVIRTKRLVLRETDDSDLEDIYFLRSDPDVNKYLGGGSCLDHDAAKKHIDMVRRQYVEGKTFIWSIDLSEFDCMIGSICFWNICHDAHSAEVGYALHPDHQHRGYMHEAMKAVLDFGFRSLRFKHVEAFTSRHNKPSLKLLEKNAFIRDESKSDDEFPDNHIYVLSSKAWCSMT